MIGPHCSNFFFILPIILLLIVLQFISPLSGQNVGPNLPAVTRLPHRLLGCFVWLAGHSLMAAFTNPVSRGLWPLGVGGPSPMSTLFLPSSSSGPHIWTEWWTLIRITLSGLAFFPLHSPRLRLQFPSHRSKPIRHRCSSSLYTHRYMQCNILALLLVMGPWPKVLILFYPIHPINTHNFHPTSPIHHSSPQAPIEEAVHIRPPLAKIYRSSPRRQ